MTAFLRQRALSTIRGLSSGSPDRPPRRGPETRLRAATLAAAAFIALAALVAGCGAGGPSDANTLNVLAGSELQDLAPLLPAIQSATGVKLNLTYVGTLEGAERIDGGDPSDAAWFSSGRYLSLLPNASKRVVAQQQIMLSPVVIGVKQSVAQKFGWLNNPNVTWKDIEAKSADGSFHFAMTNPAASNSGLSALIGVASAVSGTSDAIDTGHIDKDALRAFFKGQTVTAGSSGFLATTYVAEQDQVDGMINYESVLMSLNAGGQLHEPLTIIYPREGIITADYPLMLLNSAKQDAWNKVVAYLREPATQQQIMTTTLRRPAVPGIALDPRFPTSLMVELPYPSNLDTINALITDYLDEIRRPASAIFVLDVSGSMEGDRLNNLKSALEALTGTDTSLTGQFSRFRVNEQVTFITFSDVVEDERDFTIEDTNPNGPDMEAIRDYVESLQAGGGTAMYDALEEAYQDVAKEQATDPNRLYSIVLMTDGETNRGDSEFQFQNQYDGLDQATRDVHTFPILFGDANKDELQTVANYTGGQLFDATAADSLGKVFKQIRGYQ